MPEIFRRKIDESSLYALWEITETTGELEGLIRLRPSEEGLYRSFLAESRRKQWLAYRILVKDLLSPEEYPVEYDASGKPYLAGSKYHISVSHSGSMAAVIISSSGLVGIDIERIRDRIRNVKDRFLHPLELPEEGNGTPDDLLTLAWCGKEALYKLYGCRGLDFRENIRLQLPRSGESGHFRGHIRMGANTREYLLHYQQIAGYQLVYAVETG